MARPWHKAQGQMYLNREQVDIFHDNILSCTFLAEIIHCLSDIIVIENVRLRACTKTGTILTNTIQFLFESYPILM